MNRSVFKRIFPQVLAWTALAALFGAPALAQGATPSQAASVRTDGEIEMDVVHGLDAAQALKNDMITAATIQGEVTLSGTVSSEGSRELAEWIAGHVAGVTKVNNNLKVGNPPAAPDETNPGAPQQQPQGANMPPGQPQYAPVQPPAPVNQTPQNPAAAARTDLQIENDVVQALDNAQALKNDLITAATIQAEVTLSGTVSSQASRQLAESIASRVPGVTKVNNDLTVGNPQALPSPAVQPEGGSQQMPPSGYPQGEYPSGEEPAYAPGQPPVPLYETPTGPVTVPQGTLLQLRTSEPVDSKRAKEGSPVQFTVIRDVAIGDFLAIPRGATVHGVVTEAKKAGVVAGSPKLALRLTSLEMGGQSYPLDSDEFKVKGPNKAGHTVGRAFGGALLGALIGGAMDGGFGAAVGAGAGATAGTASSAASQGPGVWIPSEARVDFHLMAPVTVAPVSAQEAARLEEGLYQGGPNLYRRGNSSYGRGYYNSPYGYPQVYYRPYYAVGGAYYWR